MLNRKARRKKKVGRYWRTKDDIVDRKLKELSNGDEAKYEQYKRNLLELKIETVKNKYKKKIS